MSDYTMEPTLAMFSSLRATRPTPIHWEQIVQIVRSEQHRLATELYRKIGGQLAEAGQSSDPALLGQYKERQIQIKQNQPAFAASVTLAGGRSRKDIQGFTGFIMVDIDGIPADRFPAALKQVQEDPYTFMAHTTISGKGIRVFARMEGEVGKHNFAEAWSSVNRHYEQLTGIETDGQCKNATRLSVLCYDPAAYYRPDARPFPLPVVAAKPAPRKRKVTPERAEATVRNLVETEGIRYEAHSHNAYICRCLYWMNRFGVAEAAAERWALARFADYDSISVRSTVKSCYSLTDEHDTHRLRDYETTQSARKRGKAGVGEIEQYIHRYMEIRRNLLTQQAEVRLAGDEQWQRLSDTIENSLWRAMQKEGIDADINHLRILLTSDFVPDYHPLREYLDSLPAWDGTSDPIGQLAARVHTTDPDPERFVHCFRRWLVGMLAGALNEQVVNQVIFVLIGPQGSYKTSFMQNLLPPALSRYYTSKTNSQRLTKDDLFTLTEYLLINFEEIDTLRPSELNQLKAMTTALYIDERLPYGRNKVHLPHVASFCATGNNPLFLSDDTGNRRWLVFEVSSIDSPWQQPIDHDAVYAQAKALLDSGYQYWFQESEIAEINRHNRRFEAPNPARELILSYYRKPRPDEQAKYITASQIVLRFGNSVRLTTAMVGRMLRELYPEAYILGHNQILPGVEKACPCFDAQYEYRMI